jgi:2-polyprenyl-6-methoxyphenol hydroxylase-like FAD-dependent oxidoreductase
MDGRGTAHLIYQPIPSTNVSTNLENLTCEKIPISALTVIRIMGLMKQIQQFNTTEKGTRFINSDGRPFAPFPVTDKSSASLTSEYEVLRGDLAKIMFEATKDHVNVNYLFDTTITEVLSNDDHSVKVKLDNGEIREFDLLIAADGQWSKLRKQCFPPESMQIVDMGLYVAYWTIPRSPNDNDWWNIYIALRSRIVTLRPDPHGTIRAMINCMPCNDAQKKAWLEALKSGRPAQQDLLWREFADAGWEAHRVLDSMDKAPDLYFHAVQQIKMSKWSNSRIICIGDAAYAPTPLTGMGTSLAITGAYVLAGELSKLKASEYPVTALEVYESEFRPFVEESQRILPFVPAIAHPETAWKRWLLQTFIWTLSKIIAIAVTIPWSARKLDRSNYEDFPLPQYQSFQDEGPKHSAPE